MILAIDLGSTSFKAALFDRDLKRLAAGECRLSYLSPTDDAMELAVEVVHVSVRDAVATARIDADDISAIGITSQAQTFTVSDSTGRPKRPFISWRDARASDQAKALTAEPSLADFPEHTSFHAPTPAMQISLLRRLQLAEPGVVKETDLVEQLGSHVVRALSGQSWMDENLAAMCGLYSLRENAWWPPALDVCGLRREQLPRVSPIGTSCCTTGDAAGAFGLPAGVPIVLAGNDQTAGAYGARLDETGGLLITLGTAEVVYVCSDEMPEARPGCVRGVYPDGKFYRLVVAEAGGIAEAVATLGVDPKRMPVHVAGGGSRSPVRVKQLARRLGTSVTPVDADPLLGAARMAAACLG